MPQEGSLQVPLSAGWLHLRPASEAALTEELGRRLESWNSSHSLSSLSLCVVCLVLLFGFLIPNVL